MTYLFGLIGLRGGVSAPTPLFNATKSKTQPMESPDFSLAPLLMVSVVAALQSQLLDRRGDSVQGPPSHRRPSVVWDVVCA
jgi:hypothetical protein